MKRFWTPEEVDQLDTLARHNTEPRAVAVLLGRSVAAVQSKAWAEGIPLRSSAPPRDARQSS